MATNEIKRTGPKYRKVHPLFWSLPEVNDLEADDKVTPLYVLTCEQLSRIGLFRFSIGMAAQDLGRTPEYIRDSLERVCSVMSWSFDERTQTLLIPEWFKWHPPTNQSHAVGCLEDLQ